MASVAINAICCLFIIAPVTLQALEVKFDYDYQQVPTHKSVAFECSVTNSPDEEHDLKISACEMLLVRVKGKSRTFLDLSSGKSSDLPSGYAYHAMAKNTCGLTINSPHTSGFYTLTCRVRVVGKKRWQYSKQAGLYIDSSRDLTHTLTDNTYTPNVNCTSGKRIQITANAEDGQAIDECRFWLPPHHTMYDLSNEETDTDTTTLPFYYGPNGGLASGECGVSLHCSSNITGQIYSSIAGVRNGKRVVGRRVASLISAIPPERIEFLVLKQRDPLIAMCQATLSRPAAQVTWWLDGVEVGKEEENEERESEEWPRIDDLQTTRKTTMIWNLTPDNKRLFCRVSHVALPGGQDETHFVNINASNEIPSKIAETAAVTNAKLIGGNHVDITQHPYQVSVHERITPGGSRSQYDKFVCSGSIISEVYVLTSAHCVKNGSNDTYVRAGSSHFNTGGIQHHVIDLIYMRRYVNTSFDFDVALLKVSPSFNFSASVQPIKIYDGQVPTNAKITVTGWNVTRPTEPLQFADRLQEAITYTITTDECKKNLPKAEIQRTFCSQFIPSGNCQTHGDYGGPAVFDRQLVGVTSFLAIGLCDELHPTGFTNVTQTDINAWLMRKTGMLVNNPQNLPPINSK